jgi:hypothetical protein
MIVLDLRTFNLLYFLQLPPFNLKNPDKEYTLSQTHGNKAVVDLLEKYLEVAKKHQFGNCAISMVGHPGVASIDYVGDVSLEWSQKEALGLLLGKINKSIDNWMLPFQDKSLDASYVCYNVANAPLGFDFINWLVTQEINRELAGAPAPLKVGFWVGKDSKEHGKLDGRINWLDNVFRPALGFIGAVEDEKGNVGIAQQMYVPKQIVDFYNSGKIKKVPIFRAKGDYDLPKDVITITLREAEHWPHRNSNIEAWTKFAKYLVDKGERVIFVRDTAKANEPLEGFETCPEASIDLDKRMWLYDHAKLNMFVSNGPHVLTLYNDKPWLTFIYIEDDRSTYTANTRQFWRVKQGVEPGYQYPWSTEKQKLVWAIDDYENLVKAYEDLKL